MSSFRGSVIAAAAAVSDSADFKNSVVVVIDRTTLPAYTKTGAGQLAYLEGDVNGALPDQDGVTPVITKRYLVADPAETAHADHGIYVLQSLGDAGSKWRLIRSTDCDTDAEYTAGVYVIVTEGDSYADTAWIVTTNDDITVDTTAVTWTQFSSGTASIIAGNGINKVGDTLSVDQNFVPTWTSTHTFTTSAAITGGTFVFTGTDINLDPTGGFTLDMDTGKPATITLSDNLDSAFVIQNAGGEDLLRIDTLDIDSHMQIASGELMRVDIRTNTGTSDAFRVLDASGRNYLKVDTNAPTVELGNATTNPAITQLGTGTVTLAGNVDATNGLDVTGDLTHATGTVTITPNGAFLLDMSGASAKATITMEDHTTAAFEVVEGGLQYISIDTVNGSERLNLTGGTGSTHVLLRDDQDTAFVVRQGNDHYIEVDTTNASETLNLGNVTTNPDITQLGTGTVTLAGGLLVRDGAFNAMSWAFSSDTDTGMYSGGSGGIRVVSNGTGILKFGESSDALRIEEGAFAGEPHMFAAISGAHTNLTASTEISSVDFDLSATQQWATGALATQRSMIVRAPTIAFVGASTVTDAATVAITGAPIAGANATITNAYALWVDAGSSRFDGNVDASGGLDITGGDLTAAGGAIDLDPTGNVTVDLDAAATMDITVADNEAEGAFSVNDAGGTQYIGVQSTTGTKQLHLGAIGANTHIHGAFQTVGSWTHTGGALDLDPTGAFTLDMDAGNAVTITIADNLTDSFKVRQGTTDYIEINTDNGTETMILNGSGEGDILIITENAHTNAVVIRDTVGGTRNFMNLNTSATLPVITWDKARWDIIVPDNQGETEGAFAINNSAGEDLFEILTSNGAEHMKLMQAYASTGAITAYADTTISGSLTTQARYATVATFSTGTHALASTEHIIVYTGTGITSDKITLPAATGSGRVCTIKCTGAAPDLDIDPDSSETIDGEAVLTMSVQFESITIVDYAAGLWMIM
jgi:hypothetical protein